MVSRAAAATVSHSISKTLDDANGQPWPAGQAPGRLSTEAKTVTSRPRANGRPGEASIRTSEDAPLMAQDENLEEDG